MVKWENLQSYPNLFRFVHEHAYVYAPFVIGWTLTCIRGVQPLTKVHELWCGALLIGTNEGCSQRQDTMDALDEEIVEVKEVKWHRKVSMRIYMCDWILENRPKYHTRPIPFYWPN